MKLTQDKFDQIVNALVGYSIAADALQVVLEAHGVKVVSDDDPTATVDATKALSLCDAVIHGTGANAGLIRDKASALRKEAEAAMLAVLP